MNRTDEPEKASTRPGEHEVHCWPFEEHQLSGADPEQFEKTVAALSETIRIMAEIDKVIESHGGWPGAFVVGRGKST